MADFKDILKNISGNKIYIQTHNFPDPDAISSAFGLQRLLQYENIEAKIIYTGEIDRLSTISMIKKLNIDIHRIDSLPEILKDDEIILVDAQRGNSNITDTCSDRVLCIDHHRIFGQSQYGYSDIRSDVGACASIIAEYYKEAGIAPDPDVCTALLYGIKIDTANLTRSVSKLDLDMFYDLYYKADLELISKLETSTLQLSDLHAYANAINSIKVIDTTSFANTGHNCPEALIATISDFMLDISEVSISIVYSYKKEGIRLSVRCDRGIYDAGLITNEALKGIGKGGGHAAMAGGLIPFREGMSEIKSEDVERYFLNAIRRLYPV